MVRRNLARCSARRVATQRGALGRIGAAICALDFRGGDAHRTADSTADQTASDGSLEVFVLGVLVGQGQASLLAFEHRLPDFGQALDSSAGRRIGGDTGQQALALECRLEDFTELADDEQVRYRVQRRGGQGVEQRRTLIDLDGATSLDIHILLTLTERAEHVG